MGAQNLILAAHSLEVPKDQLERFLSYGYVPLPWQLKFHAAARKADKAGPTEIGVGGARGPGKSHGVFAQVALDDAQRVKGLKGLFLRQTGKAARESFEDLISRVIAGKVRYQYNASTGMLKFPNKSRILLGGFEDEKDIDKYIGIEYDLMAIEEENQLTENKVDKLKGSLRTSKEGWRPRIYSSFNPGGLGHLFVKSRFVDGPATFIPATYKENPYLNPEYIEYLEGLKGNLGKAWREGNFDIFEGQYFGEWNRDKHISLPFAIPTTWRRYRAYDHGREAPAACGWYALDFDGRVWKYREFYQAGLNVDQIATEIKRLSGDERYEFSLADPSIFAHTGFVDKFGGQTIAESFARQGITFFPATNRRVDGWNIMHQYLYWNQSSYPKLMYFNTCRDSIRTIPALIHDDHKPEDVNTKSEDHAADCDRYFLASLHEQKAARPLNEVEQKLALHNRQQNDLNKFYSGDYYRNS